MTVNFSVGQVGEEDAESKKESVDCSFRALAEIGFLGVANHKIQFGKGTTYFDYRRDGGQDILFPISRFSLELDANDRNTWVFLYQPLEISTNVVLREPVTIDNLTFPANTNLDLTYGFPFYRLSYLRKLNLSNDRFDLRIGASLQIRNANIRFESADGLMRVVNRDVGPVPLLKLKAGYRQNEKMMLELEADGMYAPVSYLNGSDNEVVGAILDASLRQSLQISKEVSAFLNLRYLGGGAEGISDNVDQVSDGYTKNWLHFYTVSTGFVYHF